MTLILQPQKPALALLLQKTRPALVLMFLGTVPETDVLEVANKRNMRSKFR